MLPPQARPRVARAGRAERPGFATVPPLQQTRPAAGVQGRAGGASRVNGRAGVRNRLTLRRVHDPAIEPQTARARPGVPAARRGIAADAGRNAPAASFSRRKSRSRRCGPLARREQVWRASAPIAAADPPPAGPTCRTSGYIRAAGPCKIARWASDGGRASPSMASWLASVLSRQIPGALAELAALFGAQLRMR